jgi:hypothetical protein
METLRPYLDELGLSDLPDEQTLSSHFKRLVMLYHPDRNSDRKEWAQEKTRRLIEACRMLRAQYRPGTARKVSTPYSTSRQQAAPAVDDRLFQFFLGDKNFAIQVSSIDRVLMFREAQIEVILNRLVCHHDHKNYVLSRADLIAEPSPMDYVILLHKGGEPRGYILPSHSRYEDIYPVAEPEMVGYSGGRLVYRAGRMYRILA